MDILMALLVLVIHASTAFANQQANAMDRLTFMSPLGGYAQLVAGKCPGTKVPTDCKKLTNNSQKESYCCPTCDLLWPPTITAYQEVAKDPTPANVFLAGARTIQLGALAIAGSAGAVPLVGDVAANPANAVVTGLDMILPEHISPDIQCMREQFAKTKEQLEEMEARIHQNIKHLEKKVVAQKFYKQYMEFREKLFVLRGHYKYMESAINSSNCNYNNRDTCEAVQSWISYCRMTSSCNQHDPIQLVMELKNLITSDFLGETFLQTTTSVTDSPQELLQLYTAISSDIMELNMLNLKCAVALTTEEELAQRLQYAKQEVDEINDKMMNVINVLIKKHLEKDMAKLEQEAVQLDNWDSFRQAIVSKRSTRHSNLVINIEPLARRAIGKIFPLFRTYCAAYYPFKGASLDRYRQRTHDLFLQLPNLETTPITEDLRISFDPNRTRVHLSPRSTHTVCYTYVPADVQSALNNIEMQMCSNDYENKMDNRGIFGNIAGSAPENWKPGNPVCEQWKANFEQAFPLGDDRVLKSLQWEKEAYQTEFRKAINADFLESDEHWRILNGN